MSIVRVTVRAKPGASRTRVGGRYGPAQDLVVAVTPPAVDGAANDAVLRAIADALGLRPRQVSLVNGHRGRTKVVACEVDAADVDRVTQAISDLRTG